MIRHVLFDNDGTLVDSEILAVRAMLIQLRKHGLELSEQEYSSKYPGLRERDILSMIQEEYAVSIPPDFMQTLRNEHRESFQRNLRSIAGMPGLFRKVHKPKSVVSNGSLKHVNRSLKKIKLHSAAKGSIFSAEQVERPKPYPDLYQFVLEALSLEEKDVIVIEDSPTGVQSAKEAGLKVIGFLGASHIYEGHADKLRDLGADYIASDAKEVGQIFDRYDLV